MRKKILLISACLILGIIAWYTWSKKDTTLKFNETRFKLTESRKITEIRLNSAENKTTLVKSGNSWTVDNEEVDSKRIHELLILSSGIEPEAPAPLSMKDLLNEEMEKGIFVEFYIRHKTILSFDLCRIGNQIYARLENSKNAYKVTVKGYPDVDLYKIYNPSPIHWKSNILFELDPAAIESVVIQYPEKPSDGFQIRRTEHTNLMLLDYTGSDTITNIENDELSEYLYFFSGIKHLQPSDKTPSISKGTFKESAFFLLEIITSSEDTINLSGYRKQLSQSEEIDRYQFYGITSQKEYFLLNYYNFDPILVPCEYFRKK